MTELQKDRDLHWMFRALEIARLAASQGEVPIACVIVSGDRLVASAHDGKEIYKDPTAHAEILALRQAAQWQGDWRLDGMDLYVTLEPCPMCAGAIVQARIARLIYAAANVRWGACSGPNNVLADPRLNHRVQVVPGVCAQESADLLKETFRAWRNL